MKAAIRQHALELGFDDCRFTTADPPESAEQFLKWLEGRCHGTMDWMERNAAKRIDPQCVLEDARSVITLAASYGQADGEQTGPSQGVIARYARYADYHDALGQALGHLAARVQSLAGEDARSLGTWTPGRCWSATLGSALASASSASTPTSSVAGSATGFSYPKF